MSFNVVPKAGPSLASENNSQASQAQQAAKERAIARLMGNSPQGQSLPEKSNQTNASVEDLSSIAPAASSLTRQVDTNEAPSEPASVLEKSTSTEPLSPQYAVLARKEKALRAKAQAQEQAFKAKEEAFLAREAALKAKEAEYQSNYVSKDQLKADAWGTLQELGYSYEQLTQAALNQSQESPAQRAAIQALKDDIARLREEANQSKSSQQEQQTQAYKQAVNQIRMDATQLVKADPIAYEAIVKSGSINDVVELIEQTFKEDGVLMSVEEAANEVENYLIEESLKYAQFEKVKKKLKPTTQAQQPVEKQSQQSQPQKTLTNGMGAARQLSVRERAILAFKGEKQ